MPHMPAPGDLRELGRRIRQKILWALALSGVIPLLVLAYVVHDSVLPAIETGQGPKVLGLQVLVFFTLVGMTAGAAIIWSVGATVARMADLMASEPVTAQLEGKPDDVGALVRNLSRMLETIEQQANEINSFAMRLDAAYKELESTNVRLKETSFKDEVTGLYNRRFFTIRLEEEISRHRRFNHPVSIILLDLDGFKAINDDLGHAIGDDTLREVGQILLKHSRGINVVSRYGGDEFAVLLVETAKSGARLYADRIRDVIGVSSFPHGKRLTASLGVVGLPDDGVPTAEELVKLADEALYAAKRAGKNQVAAPEVLSEPKPPWNAATS
jgi:diguanylate cyclase (GGDEF)-like protein